MKENIEEFDQLLTGYFSDRLTKEELKRLHSFLESDSLYKERYNESAKLYAQSYVVHFEQEKKSNYLQLSKALGFGQPVKTQKKFHLTFWRIAVTIALLITSSIATYYIHNDITISNLTSQLVEMEVPPGSQTKVILPDSSVVILNSGSILKYDISYIHRKTREVYLNGEGYFEVKRDEERPFTVHVQELNVKVLGTAFNVRAYEKDSEIEVNLLKGSVNVYSLSETEGNIIMSPNERLIYNKNTKKMWSSKTDAARSIKWINGRLSFINTPLLDIIKKVEEEYNVKINVQTQKMADEIFSGSISTKLSVNEILDYIDVDKKYQWVWTQKNNTITITDK